MTVLHSGSNTKYSSNWTKAFKKGAFEKGAVEKGAVEKRKSAAMAKPSPTKTAKKPAKKK